MGQVVAGHHGHGVGLQPDPGRVRAGVLRRQDHADDAVGTGRGLVEVEAADDAFGVVAVVGSAVHAEREVHGVADPYLHVVRPGRIDRREAVEGIGIVAPPLLVGTDDLDEAGAGRIGPDLRVGGHLEDGQQPLVGFEQALLVTRAGQLIDQASMLCSELLQQLREHRFGLGGHGGVLARRRGRGEQARSPRVVPGPVGGEGRPDPVGEEARDGQSWARTALEAARTDEMASDSAVRS